MANLEVAGFIAPLDQFQAGKSVDMCVAFGCADIFYSSEPTSNPTATAGQIVGLAEQWYAREEGSDGAGNTNGMSIGAEYAMLDGLNLHYEALSGDLVAATREALARGLPVLITGAEAGFFDVTLGRVPYAWPPIYNHCIVASGLASNGNFYVRDYANSEFFGYRRVYSASAMRLISATAVWPRWKSEENMTPAGWKDNGSSLIAPNGKLVIAGFRLKVLAGWEPSDQPLENEHGAPGGGTEQLFTRTLLRWTTAAGVTVEAPPVTAQADAFKQIAQICAGVATS